MRKKKQNLNMTAQMLNIIQTNFKPDPMKDTEQEFRLKSALSNLNEVDKRILILYAEYASIRDVAKILGSTYHYTCKKIREIKNDLLKTI